MKIQEKITGLLVLYFLVALAAIGSTLYVSWRLEGGAAAINDAGSERMRSYHIAFLLAQQVQQPSVELRRDIEAKVGQFERILGEIERGDPYRPLALPKDEKIRAQMERLRQDWQTDIKPRIFGILDARQQAEQVFLLSDYRTAVVSFVEQVNDLVNMLEHSNARATNLLRTFQIALVSLALVGTVLMMSLFTLMVVRPVTRLQEGIRRMGKADFAVRLPPGGQDEFGELSRGFNQMADQLQDLYTNLERRVEEKTRSLESKNRELATLYDVAAYLNSSTATQPLCDSVLEKLSTLMGTGDGLVRLVDHSGEDLNIVASRGIISQEFLNEESCLKIGTCLCGEAAQDGVAVSSDFSIPSERPRRYHCRREGFQAVVAVPIRSKQRVLGILNLFFREPRVLPEPELLLLEAVGQHLGIAIENQLLVAREKEMAVSEERNLLAQELHDSIAQALAYLNIQVQLLQQDLQAGRSSEAMRALEKIREGVQESYDDVRELLVHFRTRIGSADLETALRAALEKFEGQTNIRTSLELRGNIPDMSPEQVLQVMHIVQESLSNVRKHAGANRVDVELVCDRECAIVIHDDGTGFNALAEAGDAHVGLRIMRERAHRIGAGMSIDSAPLRGTRVRLILPCQTKHEE